MQPQNTQKLTPKITVLGVGGAGGNAVNNMIASGLQGCDFIVCNTDAQALEGSLSENKIQLGATVTGGLGAGAKPDIGRAAAEESLDELMTHLEGANMAFITAGMGGGTGTGAAPVIARACREQGILTVGVVTKPFHFEGSHRMKMAEEGIEQMQDFVDTLIVIPNQNLFRIANEKTTFAEAFKMADSVLQSGVRGVTDLMVMPGLINLDFADIRSAMLEMGKAMMGTGEAEGESRAIEAANAAINNPLLDDVSMQGARGVIINVTGGMDMTLYEVDEACNRIRDEVDPNANIIFGSTFDEALEGVMRVSVVATGIDAEEMRQSRPAKKTHFGGTAMGVQDKKMERALPKTDVTNTQTVMAQANVSSDVAVDSKPVETASPFGQFVMPAKKPQSEAASTSNQAFSPTSLPSFVQSQPAQGTAPATAQASQMNVAHSVSEQSATTGSVQVPRGQVYNESFIPPKPVEGQGAFNDGVVASQQQNQTQSQVQSGMSSPLAAIKPTTQEAPEPITSSTGYHLKPPVPGSSQQARKKTPSLFERFTNPIKQHIAAHQERSDEAKGDDGGETSTGSSSGGMSPNVTLQKQAPEGPTQGSLAIDTPNKSASEDDLDIPAFLRRQAN
jgi:cell division protein FtsZ